MKRQPVAQVDAFASESVNLSVNDIGVRIKAARKALGLTQDQLATMSGAPSKSGLQGNESGRSMPGGQMLGTLVMAGINANWLLTGDGPMLLAELTALPAHGEIMASPFDQARLRDALQAVEEGLDATGRTMEPDNKVELVLAVYDLLQEPSVTKDRVLKLVKLAA